MYNAREVYVRMVFRMMKNDPSLQRSYDRQSRFFYQTIFKHEHGKVEVVADWLKFMVISEVFFWLASEALIAGWPVNFGKIGYLQALQFPPNMKSLTINWKETMRHARENGLPPTGPNMIFYPPIPYCSIRFMKNMSLKNVGKIRFCIAGNSRNGTAMKDKFIKALTSNQLLKNRYKHSPHGI